MKNILSCIVLIFALLLFGAMEMNAQKAETNTTQTANIISDNCSSKNDCADNQLNKTQQSALIFIVSVIIAPMCAVLVHGTSSDGDKESLKDCLMVSGVVVLLCFLNFLKDAAL